MTGICDDNTPILPLYSRLVVKSLSKTLYQSSTEIFSTQFVLDFEISSETWFGFLGTVERIFKIVASANAKEIARVTINYTRLHIEYYM